MRGGSGKTILSVGIIAALRNRGIIVAPFKKGPDYIDAGWLALAAGRPCYNLDTFLIDTPIILNSYERHTYGTDTAVIEGNRGLYDCINTDGLTSTAELAKLLDLPVILCLDATKTTRTMAAVVAGCAQFDPGVKIKGVVLNHVAGVRHENILRTSIEQHCGIPVVGAVPKLRKQSFPERHMGLVPTYEHQWARTPSATIAELAETYIDLTAVCHIASVRLRTRTDPIEIHTGQHASSIASQAFRTAESTATTHRHHPGLGLPVLLPGKPRRPGPGRRGTRRHQPPVRGQPAGCRRTLYRRRLPRNPRPTAGQECDLP